MKVSIPISLHILTLAALACIAATSRAAVPAVLRGNNYVTVNSTATRAVLYPPMRLNGFVNTFNPDAYSTTTVAADFREMKNLGYNCVRSFIESEWNAPGKLDSAGRLNTRLVANVADFTRRARDSGFFVIYSFGFVPSSYYDMIDEVCRPGSPVYDPSYTNTAITIPPDSQTSYTVAACPFAGGFNELFVHKGVVRAQVQYVLDFLDEMKARDEALFTNPAFAIEVMNEPYFDSERMPFSITTGTLTVALDETRAYNMAVSDAANDRQLLADNMLRYWLGHTIPAVKARYPDVPVIVSTFTPYTTGRSQATGFVDSHGSGFTGVVNYPILPDKRQPMRVTVINESAADIISVHGSPIPLGAATYDMAADMRSAEVDLITTTTKRLIIGEFWVPKQWFPTIESAAANVIGFQSQSVQYGFSGWLFWNWQVSDWNARSASGSIGNMLSPLFRPDPSRSADIRLIRPSGPSRWSYDSDVEIEWMSNIATSGNDLHFYLGNNGADVIDLGAGHGDGGHGRVSIRLPGTSGGDINFFRAVSVARPELRAEVPLTLDFKTSASKWFLYR